MGEIHLDRIKSTPIFVLWDPANKSAACTIKSQIKTIESKITTVQKTDTYSMKSDRVDRFAADDKFIDQLASALNAETHIEVVETPKTEAKPEKEATKKGKSTTPSNSTAT